MAVRRKRNLLDPLLVRSSSAACVLDADLRIRFATAGFEALAGWPTDQLEGLVCDPSPKDSTALLDLLTSALAPPPAVMKGKIEASEIMLPNKEGRSQRVLLTFVPLADDEEDVDRVLVVARPATGKSTATPIVQRLHAEITQMRLQFRRRFGGQSFVGQCPAIQRAMEQVELLQGSGCGYEIVGPPGSGRRHLARMVHVGGQQSDASFLAIDCHLLQAEHLLTTLRQLQQLAEEASPVAHQMAGTLLMHNVHECPREVQQWLLENRSSLATDVRLVAAGDVPLSEVEQDGWALADFRQLFAAVQVVLPPLHDRSDDVLLLAQHFLEHSRRIEQTSAAEMDDAFKEELQFYRWPGNVRELRDVMFEACQNSFEARLTVDDLPFSFKAGLQAQQMPTPDDGNPQSLSDLMEDFEKKVLLNALDACGNNKAEAARRLGLTRPKLYRRLDALGLDGEEPAS